MMKHGELRSVIAAKDAGQLHEVVRAAASSEDLAFFVTEKVAREWREVEDIVSWCVAAGQTEIVGIEAEFVQKHAGAMAWRALQGEWSTKNVHVIIGIGDRRALALSWDESDEMYSLHVCQMKSGLKKGKFNTHAALEGFPGYKED